MEVEDEEENDDDGEVDESANSSFVAMGDDGWLFVSSLLRCMVEMLLLAIVAVDVAAPGTVTLMLSLLREEAAMLAPYLCLIVMSNTLTGSSCVMIIGGSSDHVLLAFNPEIPTGSHSLNVLISLPDSLFDTLFVVDSKRTTDSIIAGVGLMTANSVSLPEAAVAVIVSLLLPCDTNDERGVDDDDDGDEDGVLGDVFFLCPSSTALSFRLSASFFLT